MFDELLQNGLDCFDVIMEILKKKIPFKCPKTRGVTLNACVHSGHLSGKEKKV